MPVFATISWGGVGVVGGMYAAFLGVGWLATRKVKEGSVADLLVAGRSMPVWLAVMTMTATWVDGGYLLGTVEGAYRDNLAVALQPGVCYGISLLLGGLFFAAIMRRHAFTTLIDPFEARFGRRWAAILFLPAMLGETLWSGSLLVAIGSTFSIILGFDTTTSVIVSATVVTFYTMLGGMWSVAYTDAFQLALIPLGLLAALPFALMQVGGLEQAFDAYRQTHAGGLNPFPSPAWELPRIVQWWDMTAMLLLGGIPWNCYFQRVLSCASPEKARTHSYWAGLTTISLTIPPALLGIAAATYAWPSADAAELQAQPNLALPLLLRDVVPYGIGILGLGAIVGAVTSSFSSSILSAGSMFSWNVYRRLLAPDADLDRLKWIIRGSVVLLGVGSTLLALRVQSVIELWTLCSDLVFVLLFPQLVMALFDPRANRLGSMAAFAASLGIRLGAGDTTFGIPAVLPEADLFPYKTIAMLIGLVLLPTVSRLTARWDPPRSLGRLTFDEA